MGLVMTLCPFQCVYRW